MTKPRTRTATATRSRASARSSSSRAKARPPAKPASPAHPPATAKDIQLRPISGEQASELVRRVHYSGKTTPNSQLHIGVFLHGRLEGAMQFGPSMDKRQVQGLVAGTGWNEFMELNRMAFSEALPRNSESRALAVAIRMLRKYAPHLKWIISYADATQCGDGTIYRAAGFTLTGVTKNTTIWDLAGVRFTNIGYRTGPAVRAKVHAAAAAAGRPVREISGASMQAILEAGGRPVEGFMVRYIYFLDPSYKSRLTVPELPYSALDKIGARMYKGKRRGGSIDSDAAGSQLAEGGASPTSPLHSEAGS